LLKVLELEVAHEASEGKARVPPDRDGGMAPRSAKAVDQDGYVALNGLSRLARTDR
jgi:hypothetical protein